MKIVAFLLTITLYAALPQGSVVTYSDNKGRFGDCLVSLAHAKWISHVMKIPLAYTPFPYSDLLTLSIDPSVLRQNPRSHLPRFFLREESDFLKLWRLSFENIQQPLSIEVPYYAETAYEYTSSPFVQSLVNWEDPLFLEEFRRLVSPLIPIPKLSLPQDRLNIALHVRTGIGFDEPTWERFHTVWPMKSPAISYFENALKLLSKEIQRPLYAFIFTDHPDPMVIQKDLEERCSRFDIRFECRAQGNRHYANVLEDFFSMAQFDCLIRGDSNYSVIASKLFPFQIIVSPIHFYKESDQRARVDQILIQMQCNSGAFQPIKIQVPMKNP